MKFRLTIFLLAKSSSTRIITSLIEDGWNVESGLMNNKIISNDPGASFPMFLFIEKNSETNFTEVNKILKHKLLNLEVPFYGFTLTPTSAEMEFSPGWLPDYP